MSHDITIRDTGVKITDILSLISRGHTYEQILKSNSVLQMTDILAAAAAATELIEKVVEITDEVTVGSTVQFTARLGKFQTLDELRRDFPRAYEKWETAEENDLTARFKKGESIGNIAKDLQRTAGSVRVRLIKLGLIEDTGRYNSGRPPRNSN